MFVFWSNFKARRQAGRFREPEVRAVSGSSSLSRSNDSWASKRALLLKRLLLLALPGIAEAISDYPLRGSATAIRTKSARDFAPIFL